MSFRIVTDSTSDIPWSFAKEKGIKVVPLSIIIHEKVYKEDENFDYDAYYRLFEEEKAYFHIPKLKLFSFVPKTSQPSPGEFYQAYESLIKEGAKEIISIHVTKGLSGTINSARLGAKNISRKYKDVNIHIIDSKSASFPELHLIRLALKLIEKNKKTGEEIASILREQALNIKTHILLPTLKYLWKGGRLSTTKFLIGNMLRRKPIITMNKEGEVEAVKAVKEVDEGLRALLHLSTNNLQNRPKEFSIVYGTRLDYAEKLADYIKEWDSSIKIEVARSYGSVLSHLGPESIGLISNFIEIEI
ncbi:MAG: DegV family protein [Candidatus Heimdallarchaeaceae archaeon]